MQRALSTGKPPAESPAWYSFAGMVPVVTPSREPQSAGAVLMVRPARFAFNPQTAGSNAFQSLDHGGRSASAVQTTALREFDGLADTLARVGVTVVVVEDTASPIKPDAVFPNNWVSFHADGTVVTYPMLASNRRWERREEILGTVVARGGFRTSRTVDLSYREDQSQFLEGTGSLVLDRANRLAYASLSPRTDLNVLGEFAQLLEYELVTFESFDTAGAPIYHTNVMMAIGTGFAVVCGEVISDSVRRAAVADQLRATGHEVIDISRHQMQQFAGNLLELRSPGGCIIALSTAAWGSFDAGQRRALERHGRIAASDIPLIEALGGGGVRCMLVEIHLPKR